MLSEVSVIQVERLVYVTAGFQYCFQTCVDAIQVELQALFSCSLVLPF